MGFSNVNTVMFSQDMPQTPANVEKVLDIAGWTVNEAAAEIRTDPVALQNAKIPKKVWLDLLNKAGRRAFDADEHTS